MDNRRGFSTDGAEPIAPGLTKATPEEMESEEIPTPPVVHAAPTPKQQKKKAIRLGLQGVKQQSSRHGIDELTKERLEEMESEEIPTPPVVHAPPPPAKQGGKKPIRSGLEEVEEESPRPDIDGRKGLAIAQAPRSIPSFGYTSSADTATNGGTTNSTENRSTAPGAFRADGNNLQNANEVRDDDYTVTAPSISPSLAPEAPSAERLVTSEHLVSAFVVDDDNNDTAENGTPFATASALRGYWTRRKVLIAVLAVFVMASLTAVTVYLVTRNNNNTANVGNLLEGGTSSPTMSAVPSAGPSQMPSPSPSTSAPSTSLPSRDPSDSPSFAPTLQPSRFPRSWIRMGQDHLEYSEDELGASVSLSKHGNWMVVGGPGGNDGEGDGMVHIYKNTGQGFWEKYGRRKLYGNTADDFGRSTSISDDGRWVAIGAPFRQDYIVYDDAINVENRPGRVRVYQRVEVNLTYEQVGSDLVGIDALDKFGHSVSISSRGDTVAVGARDRCLARVFKFDNVTTQDWKEVGQSLECFGTFNDTSQSTFGSSISISADGSIVAVGAPGVYERFSDAAPSGRAVVFRFNGNTWTQLGQVLMEGESNDQFGTSIALSDDGMRIAIGSPHSEGGSTGNAIKEDFGIAQVFEYVTTTQMWQQLGSTIRGLHAFDRLGRSISLSSDGTILAVGAEGSNSNGEDSGSIQVFVFNHEDEWEQFGDTIVGPVVTANAGSSIAMSGDGSVVAVGMTGEYDANFRDGLGLVQVYETGIPIAGDFPITVYLNATDKYDIGWWIERLDVSWQSKAIVSNSVPTWYVLAEYAFETDETTTSLLVPAEGVYRFVIYSVYGTQFYYPDDDWCCGIPGTYSIYLGSDAEDESKRIVHEYENFTSSSTSSASHAFVARQPDTMFSGIEDTGVSVYNLTLLVEFDSRPDSVWWVLKAVDYVVHPSTGRRTRKEMVVSWGGNYDALLLIDQTVEEVIDISQVVSALSDQMQFEFYFIDEQMEFACCERGAQSYQIFNGTGNEVGLLSPPNRTTRMRRKVELFRLFPTSTEAS